MSQFITVPVLLCLLSVLVLLIADRRGSALWQWVAKPLAAAAFLWAALEWGALDSRYGRWVLLGLGLSALGDVLLIPKGSSRCFLAGLGAFLLGHLAYVAAFAFLPLERTAAALGAVAMAVVAFSILRWLLPAVAGTLRLAVVAYVAVISAMVTVAAAAAIAGAYWLLLAGAVGFALSDLAVARNRFISPGFVNRLWGLPLYFGSQLLIASTVSLPLS